MNSRRYHHHRSRLLEMQRVWPRSGVEPQGTRYGAGVRAYAVVVITALIAGGAILGVALIDWILS